VKNEILKLKKEKNAVILAHSYQNIEIDEVADYVGDSLYLSQMATKTDADIIVFAGVYFMAETAKILSNAVKIVKSLETKEVLFCPDTYLGKWVEGQLEGVNVITYPGYCPTHLRVKYEDIINIKEKYPNALVLAHPECHQAVAGLADYVGSTTGIMNFAKESDKKQFIIVTEIGVVERLQRDCPGKEFILASEKLVCHNMKWHHLDDILNCLKYEQYEVNVDEDIAKKAITCINRMLEVSR